MTDLTLRFAFSELDLINGKYQFNLVGVKADGSKVDWNLGVISVWFKEGTSELVNDGLLSKFVPESEIVSEFPPADKVT
jgi:hypothetical protein